MTVVLILLFFKDLQHCEIKYSSLLHLEGAQCFKPRLHWSICTWRRANLCSKWCTLSSWNKEKQKVSTFFVKTWKKHERCARVLHTDWVVLIFLFIKLSGNAKELISHNCIFNTDLLNLKKKKKKRKRTYICSQHLRGKTDYESANCPWKMQKVSHRLAADSLLAPESL